MGYLSDDIPISKYQPTGVVNQDCKHYGYLTPAYILCCLVCQQAEVSSQHCGGCSVTDLLILL